MISKRWRCLNRLASAPVPVKVVFPFIGDSVGGSHKSALLLIEDLAQNDVGIEVILNQTGPLSRELKKRDIAYSVSNFLALSKYQKNPTLSRWRIFLSMLKVTKIIRRARPTIVHLNDARVQLTWTFPAFVLAIPCVWHQRTILSPSRLTHLLMRFATNFICISIAVDQSMTNVTKKERHVIFNPIQKIRLEQDVVTKRRNELASGMFQSSEDACLIGFVGNMRAVKRPEVFARVIVDLNSRLGVRCSGVIIGEDREGYIEEIVRITRSIEPPAEIHFLGFQEDPEQFIAACDILMAPAVGEGFGRALLEAMMLDVPVVAADSGGHKEIIDNEQNGLLVRPDDVEQFSQAIEKLISTPGLRANMISGGRKTVARYSAESHGRLVRKVYTSVVNAPQ